ncbi:MAG: 3-isopropylmalate dehydrogenase [SAR324 cluster bacterium]|uniref:3-isopropylmalate dehydrogenase n=1 Tax=SAR324 cluster bacterium TaxID=2024889 RepID=A0A7X9FRG8_9DELT|nr:3-isopropylmalate dehydrogenase [SAR324 cluster bacterium]
MEAKIAVLSGDGIGPEVMNEALRVLEFIGKKYNHKFQFNEALIGGAAFEILNKHFPEETQKLCEECDAILFGSVGGPVEESESPKWKDCERNSLLGLRKSFAFNVNLRPARVYPELRGICPLKAELIEAGVDLLIVRELSGDIYFGDHLVYETNGRRAAKDVALYDEDQITAIAHTAFKAAAERSKKVTSVDKANVLETSRLWRAVICEVSQEYPNVLLENMLVDNCAMQLIRNPSQFDVIVTSNLFGDILSDEAAVLPGSLGLTPSASFNKNGFGLYEPSGGSAPDLAGKGIANPIAQILSAALMLRYSFNLKREALTIENAVEQTLQARFRTKDIYQEGQRLVGTREFTDELLKRI